MSSTEQATRLPFLLWRPHFVTDLAQQFSLYVARLLTTEDANGNGVMPAVLSAGRDVRFGTRFMETSIFVTDLAQGPSGLARTYNP
jgi:hypothetical protein